MSAWPGVGPAHQKEIALAEDEAGEGVRRAAEGIADRRREFAIYAVASVFRVLRALTVKPDSGK